MIASAAVALPAAAAIVAWTLRSGGGELPEGLSGNLVYVSDAPGTDSLYVRRLPSSIEKRLTWTSEPVADPAISPDGGQVAYAAGGRIELVHLTTGDAAALSLGVEWRDTQPAWRPDGRALLVSARRDAGSRADLHLLELQQQGALASRRPLTDTPGVEETQPVFGPAAATVIYASQGGLYELDLETGLTKRLTRGLEECWGARFLPGGDLVWLWREGKRYGIDRLGGDGTRRTLRQSAAAYRSVAPSPDGAWLVATLGLDLSFGLGELLKPRPTEELHLLDADGRLVATLASAWGHSYHSGEWGR